MSKMLKVHTHWDGTSNSFMFYSDYIDELEKFHNLLCDGSILKYIYERNPLLSDQFDDCIINYVSDFEYNPLYGTYFELDFDSDGQLFEEIDMVLEEIFGGKINYVALVHDEERGIYVNTDETGDFYTTRYKRVRAHESGEFDRESDVAFYSTFSSLKQDVLLEHPDNVPELLGITKFDDLEGALKCIDFDKEYKTYIYQYASEI